MDDGDSDDNIREIAKKNYRLQGRRVVSKTTAITNRQTVAVKFDLKLTKSDVFLSRFSFRPSC